MDDPSFAQQFKKIKEARKVHESNLKKMKSRSFSLSEATGLP
jgi:hypothetical protein